MSELTRLTAEETALKLRSKEISAEEVTRAHLDRIEEVDGEINAYLAVNDDALDAAREIDKRRGAGEDPGALAGVPVAVKDILVTTDMPTTAASRMLEGYRSPFDATVVRKARNAGLILLGKTNMDEFAMGSSSETSGYGPTHNPWDLTRIPGGSGGGSAAALAAFTTPLAFGSDTGGSIRQPAALTGTVGMKPTYGAVSRYGAIALGSSLDQIGPCARTVVDTALMHDLIVGHDHHEATSIQRTWPSMAEAARDGLHGDTLKGLNVGVFKQYAGDAIQPELATEFETLLTELRGRGANIIELDAPELDYGAAVYLVLMAAEASSNLAKFDAVRFGVRVVPEGATSFEEVLSASRGAGFGHEVKRRLLLGAHVLSAAHFDRFFTASQRMRTLIQRAYERAFAEVDVIVSLASAATAHPLGEQPNTESGMLTDSILAAANLAGLPALGLPIARASHDGLPVGAQIVAPAMEDARAYRVGAAIERLVTERMGAPFWQSIPPLPRKVSAS